MRTTIKFIIITLLFSVGLDEIQAQMAAGNYAEEEAAYWKTFNGFQDSVLKSTPVPPGSNVIYGGIGFGYMMKGGFFGMKCKFVSPSRWGTSIDFKFGASRTENLPYDYSPLFYPKDKYTVVSVNLVRVLTGRGQNPTFSAEVGPSLVGINNAIIIPNPEYDPNSIWHLSKYIKTYEKENALGLSMSIETEILLTSYMIMDISIFANLNKLTSFLGIGIYIGFGDVIY
jgi:hypothetical protein